MHALILSCLLLLSYGLYEKKIWSRKFTQFFLAWASLWNIWALIIGNNILINGFLLIIYFSLFLYLLSPSVNYYFSTFFHYGPYQLYTRMVKLHNGFELPIYFFSKRQPKSGRPSQLPDGFYVKENNNSHMPYLQKMNDSIIEKKTQKNKDKSKVIYVVKQDNKGNTNWIVRNSHKLISNHKTKVAAIKNARAIAIINHARILVQNKNGKFQFGFTPRIPKNHH